MATVKKKATKKATKKTKGKKSSKKGKAAAKAKPRKKVKATPRRKATKKKKKAAKRAGKVPLGRISWLTKYPDRRAALIDGFRQGLCQERACARVSIAAQRCAEWLAKGRLDIVDGEATIYAQFAEEVRGAEAAYFAGNLQQVNKAVDGYEEEVIEVKTETVVIKGKMYEVESVKTRKRQVFHPDIALKVLERKDPANWGTKQEVKHKVELDAKRITLQGPDPLSIPVVVVEGEA